MDYLKLTIIELIKKDGFAIQYIEEPSEELQLLAIAQNPYAICYISDPTEKVKIEAIRKNGHVIKYIENYSEKLWQEAIKDKNFAATIECEQILELN